MADPHDAVPTLESNIGRTLASLGDEMKTPLSKRGSETDSDSDVSDDGDSFLSEDDSDFEKRMRRARERDSMSRRDYVIIEKHKSLIKKIRQEEESSGSSGDVLQAAAYTEPLIEPDDGRIQNIKLENLVSNLCHIRSHHTGRTVFLQGNSGSGKTFITRKIMLDWASKKHFYFEAEYIVFFYVNCEELKCSSEKMSLIDILRLKSSLTTTEIRRILRWSSRVLIIIDGLEKLEPLQIDYRIIRKTEKALPEKVILSLLQKRILRHSSLLITSRTDYPERTFYHCEGVKLMGFSEQAVEEFFWKFFQEDVLLRKSLECVKANGALFTFCSVPLICWMVCTIMKEKCSDGGEMTCDLETTTSIYVDFVFTILKRHGQGLNQPVESLLKSLGRLADKGILEQQVLLDEKTVDEIVPGLSDSPFLCTFLLKTHVQKKTVLSFRQVSFQEFFTALYYVLLDEGQAKEKVQDLLQLVDKRRAWSYLSEVSSFEDAEVSQSQQWQPIIVFLCGLCKKNSTSYKTHNLALAKNIETQLKEWIRLCVERNHKEDLLFILRCLYELHDGSFVAEILDGLALMDLSDVRLKKTDIPVLLFSLQNIQSISKMRISLKLEDLQFLQSKLPKCKSLWLEMDCTFKEAGHLIPVLLGGTAENELIIKSKKDHCLFHGLVAAVKDGQVMLCVALSHMYKRPLDIRKLTLTCPEQTLSTVGWQDIVENFLQTFISDEKEKCSLDVLHFFPGLRTVHFETKYWNDEWTPFIISVIQACPNLNQLRVDSIDSFIEFADLPELLKKSGWTLKVQRKSLLVECDRTSVTESKPETDSTEDTEVKAEEEGTGRLSHCSKTTSEQSSSEAEEQFTPDRVNNDDKDDDCCGGNTLEYRFVCPHAGRFRCSFTNLLFVMEGEGQVRYRVVGWDPRILSGLGQMMPAGPLYKINCTTTSVTQVHFPHCEIFSEETESSLSVAHIVSGNVEVLEPVTVTGSHVVLNITDLSLYGLLKKVIFHFFPVNAQLLLFLRSATEEENILDVYLLPSSVYVDQVKDQHSEDLYIQTSSKCCLTPGTEYSLCCETLDTEVQPETVTFECDFGPNYHTIFEVFVKINVVEVRLGLWDKTSKTPAWEPRRVILKASRQPPQLVTNQNPTEFVDRHQDSITQRVTSVMSIAESLRTKGMINKEMFSNIAAEKTQMKKMRLLFDVLDSGGDAVKAEFFRLLKTNEPNLVKDLEKSDRTQRPELQTNQLL